MFLMHLISGKKQEQRRYKQLKKIINSKIVEKTKKAHKCFGCGREFAAGSSMESYAMRINGVMTRKYFCVSCHKILNTKREELIEKMEYGSLLMQALLIEGKRGNK